MFGYASDETEVCMPLTILIATRLGKKLTDVRKDGSLWWLRPDGKTQVTIEYKQNDDGSVEPLKIHTVDLYTACRANQGNAQQRMRWVQRARDDCTNHGDDEQGHREGCDREVLGGDQAQERQASSVLIWRSHPPSHQSVWKVHHWWSTGRRWPHRPQDHHRHIWWLGRTRWWSILRQGSHQGRPLSCIHLQADGQVCSEVWSL